MRKLKNKKRIAIITHNYPANSKDRKDAGIFIYDFAQELAKKVDVFVFCPDFGGNKEKYKRVPVTWFKLSKGNEKFGNWKIINPIYAYKFFKLIYIGQKEAIKFAKENKVDYCLCCWAVPGAIFGLRVKQALGIPYASWSLGSDVNKYVKFPVVGQLISLSMKQASNLFANSFKLCEKVTEISKKKCLFLPAITDFKLKKIKTPNIDRRRFNFLYVGRLEPVKGPDILIEAITILSKQNKKFTVSILGDGSMGTSLKEKAVDLKDYVKFFGWANEETVGGFMKACDCLIIPSRNESLPLVMIEAAKVSLPLIAADVGDCKRMIKKYQLGLTFAKEDAKGLSNAMLKIMTKNKYRKTSKFHELTQDFSQRKAVDFLLSEINR